MLFAAFFLLVCGAGFAIGQSATSPLPNPVVDLSHLTIKGKAPWGDACCILSREIHSYFKYIYSSTTIDVVRYDIDYFCEELAYSITQLLQVQKKVRDCRTISHIIARMVANKILELRGKSTTTVFNNAFLLAFRTFSFTRIGGSSASSSTSIVSVLKNILVSKGVSTKEIAYLVRRIEITANSVLSNHIVQFLERLELSHVLMSIGDLQVKVMNIINGTSYSDEIALKQIRAVIKTTLLSSTTQAMDSYVMRAYYVSYFKAALASVDIEKYLATVRFVLESHSHLSFGSSGEIDAVLGAFRSAFTDITQWLSGFVHGIESRDKTAMIHTLRISGASFNEAYLSTLIDSLGWVNFRHVDRSPKNLLAEYKDVLLQLTKYQQSLQNFSSTLLSAPQSEQKYHQQSLAFVKHLIHWFQKEITDNNWVHKYIPHLA